MAKSVRYGFFMLQTILIHIVFLYSIFDIYFTSPLLHGMEGHGPSIDKPPAKRLVLYIADGLRADACFEDTAMPYIREMALKRGSWRVSHTRVPTESRPGHVAIIAGFYEDVSAVAKGWKENPVEFDSVFNQSHKTWAFGSPDIINIFTKGNIRQNIEVFSYPSELHDFAAKELTALDTWCFNKVDDFFTSAKSDDKLAAELDKEQTVFFVYLPGIDTNGHRYNPISNETRANIQLVDKGIKRLTKVIDDYYGDNSTAYIMTSDHGMTAWGTHGSGLAHETLTPMVAWGSGVTVKSTEADQMSVDKAEGILQADIAAFMTALLAIKYPVNNVGMLPTDLLSVDDRNKAELMFGNTLQIVEQFLVSLRNKQKTTFNMIFRPYSPLSASKSQSIIRSIRILVHTGKYVEAITECRDLIQKSLDGINYYHKYDRMFLGGCITLGFIGWMLHTLVFLLENFVYHSLTMEDKSQNRPYQIVWWIIRGLILLTTFAQSLPWTHMLYSIVPTFPLQYVISKLSIISHFCDEMTIRSNLKSLVVTVTLLVVILEVMVHSFFHRQLLSLAMLILALTDYRRYDWLISCLIVMVFPALPVVGRGANYYLVISSGIAAVIAFSFAEKAHSKISYLQTVLMISANLNVMYSSYSINNGDGLHPVSQGISWFIFVMVWLLPVLDKKEPSNRLLTVNAGLFSLYNLMSTSYESWFLLALSLFLQSWIKKESRQSQYSSNSGTNTILEQNMNQTSEHKLSLSDIQRSLIYLLMITVGFFGTGNIASLNSFEPASMFCFITKFNPYSMGFILLLKVIIPFILIACGFHVITSQSGTRQDGVFLIILLMSDFMGLHFFMWVQDYGSWLDIGTSISHYVITLVTTLVLIILSKFSQFIMTFSLLHPDKADKMS